MKINKITPFIWKDDHLMISGKMAFKFFSQMGIPVESFEDMVNEQCPPGSLYKTIFSIRAYDNAKGTNYSAKLSNLIENRNGH